MSNAEYFREWRKKNPEKDKATKERFKEKHPEIGAKYQARYRATHPDRMKKPAAWFSHARCAAKRRGKTWNLSFEQWWNLVEPNRCHYCDGPLSDSYACCLDRLDNSIGYEINNVVPCCGPCNSIKGVHLTYSEMVEVARLLKELRRGSYVLQEV